MIHVIITVFLSQVLVEGKAASRMVILNRPSVLNAVNKTTVGFLKLTCLYYYLLLYFFYLQLFQVLRVFVGVFGLSFMFPWTQLAQLNNCVVLHHISVCVVCEEFAMH